MAALEPISVAFLLYPNVTQLDLTGPAQVLSRLGNQKIDLVWKHRDPVPTDAGFSILPTATLERGSERRHHLRSRRHGLRRHDGG